MADEELLRVVVVRRGKVRPAEYRLREGEIGLSLFRKAGSPSVGDILEAVRSAGKQGDLAVAEISARLLRELGLRVVATPGGTSDPAVNALHVEARLPWWRWWLLRLRKQTVHGYFNDRIAPRIAEAAKLIEE